MSKLRLLIFLFLPLLSSGCITYTTYWDLREAGAGPTHEWDDVQSVVGVEVSPGVCEFEVVCDDQRMVLHWDVRPSDQRPKGERYFFSPGSQSPGTPLVVHRFPPETSQRFFLRSHDRPNELTYREPSGRVIERIELNGWTERVVPHVSVLAFLVLPVTAVLDIATLPIQLPLLALYVRALGGLAGAGH